MLKLLEKNAIENLKKNHVQSYVIRSRDRCIQEGEKP